MDDDVPVRSATSERSRCQARPLGGHPFGIGVLDKPVLDRPVVDLAPAGGMRRMWEVIGAQNGERSQGSAV